MHALVNWPAETLPDHPANDCYTPGSAFQQRRILSPSPSLIASLNSNSRSPSLSTAEVYVYTPSSAAQQTEWEATGWSSEAVIDIGNRRDGFGGADSIYWWSEFHFYYDCYLGWSLVQVLGQEQLYKTKALQSGLKFVVLILTLPLAVADEITACMSATVLFLCLTLHYFAKVLGRWDICVPSFSISAWVVPLSTTRAAPALRVMVSKATDLRRSV